MGSAWGIGGREGPFLQLGQVHVPVGLQGGKRGGGGRRGKAGRGWGWGAHCPACSIDLFSYHPGRGKGGELHYILSIFCSKHTCPCAHSYRSVSVFQHRYGGQGTAVGKYHLGKRDCTHIWPGGSERPGCGNWDAWNSAHSLVAEACGPGGHGHTAIVSRHRQVLLALTAAVSSVCKARHA